MCGLYTRLVEHDRRSCALCKNVQSVVMDVAIAMEGAEGLIHCRPDHLLRT